MVSTQPPNPLWGSSGALNKVYLNLLFFTTKTEKLTPSLHAESSGIISLKT